MDPTHRWSDGPLGSNLIDQPNQRMSESALYYDCLLDLPETSDAFSAHPRVVSVPRNKGLEKPPPHSRKTPRLTRDTDSASASRSRGVGTPLTGRDTDGATQDDDVAMRDVGDEDTVVSVVLRVEGAPCTFPLTRYLVAHTMFTLFQTNLRRSLANTPQNATVLLPGSFDTTSQNPGLSDPDLPRLLIPRLRIFSRHVERSLPL